MRSLSVVIPTFNRVETLARALNSVLAQSLQADEVIVIDDGSRDKTAELIAQGFPQVLYYRQENRGVSAARNKGIELASSEWIAFLDSDDQWFDHKLQTQVNAWSKSKSHSIVHSDENWFRNGIKAKRPARYGARSGRIYTHCLELCAISPSSAVIKKDLLLEVGGFDEGFPVCEDYDLWLRLCASNSVLACCEPLLLKHGGHDDQLSTKTWGMDIYRIRALFKLVRSSKFVVDIDATERAQTLSVLSRKIHIVLNGAIKRGNQELVDATLKMRDAARVCEARYG